MEIEVISGEAFSPFGTVVDWTDALDETGRGFHIVVRSEEPTGWRLALLKVVARRAQRMENHPRSEELFAPLEGRAVLLAAPRGELAENSVRAFLLDRPVSVGPGVWHAVFALSDFATILIAENLQVSGERSDLSHPIGAQLSLPEVARAGSPPETG